MPEDKEWSAVAALLDEINSLKQRVDTLEAWLWVTHPRTAREAEDAYRYRIWATPTRIPANEPMYAVTNDNITIPLTSTSWYYGATTYCTSSHSWV